MLAIDKIEASLKALIVDDDPLYAEILRSVVENAGLEVMYVSDGGEVGNALAAFKPDVIFLDLVLPGFDGVEIIEMLTEIECRARIVLMSGLDRRTLGSVKEVAQSRKLDLLGVLAKPLEPGAAEDLLQPLLEASKEAPTVTPVPAARTDLSLGPQVVYEGEWSLGTRAAENERWVRAFPVWRNDKGELMHLGQILEQQGAGLGRGIVEFMLATAGHSAAATKLSKVPGIRFRLSKDLLHDPATPNFIEEAVSRAGRSTATTLLEVVDRDLLADVESALNVMSRLKIKGFRIAVLIYDRIDQTLSHLQRLPVDEIVVSMKGEDLAGCEIRNTEIEFQLGSLVSMAEKSGITTAVTDIESQDQMSLAVRCNFAKGSGPFVKRKGSLLDICKFYANNA